MSNFKQYLAESKKTYSFKVKIAGDVDKSITEKMKIALSKFDCSNVSKPKRTPITETPLDFPNLKFTHVNIFDVTCNYPGTTQELTSHLAEVLNMSHALILVRTESEDQEQTLDIASKNRIGTKAPAILNKPYEDSKGGQALVGENRLSFLKELGKVKHAGEQVKGVNDQLLAKSAPTGSSPKEKGR
jgi:hypothetical protein